MSLENLMASDVADASVLKRNVVRLLLKHPQGIKYGDFSGAFYKLHGHHPQLALHGYSSLKYLLTDMKNMVVLEKDSQATVVKLANDVLFNQCLDDGEGWESSEEGSDSSEMQSLSSEEAEDAAGPCGPATSLDTDFSARNSVPQKMGGKNSESPSLTPPLDIDFCAYNSSTTAWRRKAKKAVLAAVLVPVLSILRDYPSGLDLQALIENLKKRGFDLERFSQDMGYGDTIHCLLEMPGLHLSFFNDMVPHNCVVQLLSSSLELPALPLGAHPSLHKPLSPSSAGTFPQHAMKTKPASHCSTTSQATASLSCDLACSASKSKTLNQNVLGKKPGGLTAPKEVLALLTNLLKAYPVGLRIKKLQELLLAMKGFDLEKFSIAQGYKDTLEFLEHQMPKLKIKYCENRRNCVVKQGKRKRQKKSQGFQERMTKSPEEVLALLTNLLKTYPEGLRVKKLQEFFLSVMGFDLEKFSVAQGYEDTLEFLEHQIPGLTIRYREHRPSCVVMQGPDVKVAPPLPKVQPKVESTKMVEPPNATPDSGGISKPVFREAAKAGPGASAPLQNGLRSGIPVPSTVIPNHPSSKEQRGTSSGKDKSSLQPHSHIPAQQSNACQFGGPSAAGESSCPTDAQVLSKSSMAKPSHPEHLDELKQQVAHILARHPEGMSLFQFRAAYSTTYQHHLPLGNASSAKQRLLEMSDIVVMKGYGVQTLILPVSPEEPPTKPGPPVFSRGENAAVVLADSLPKAVVRPQPVLVSKPSLLKTSMEPQPHATRPMASDHLRAPDIKENHVLSKGQCPTTPKMVAPSQEPVRPKISFGAYPDSFKAEEADINVRQWQCPTTPKVVAPLQEPVRPKISFGAYPDSFKAEEADIDVQQRQCPTTPKVVAPSQEPVRPKISFGAYPDFFKAEEAGIKENCVIPKGQCPTTPKVVAPLQEPVRPKISFGGYPDSSKAEEAAKNLGNSLTEAAVRIEPVVVPESSTKPSLSKSAAVPVPPLRPFVPSISTCLKAPGNKENSFLSDSLPPRPPKPSIPVGKNIRVTAMPEEKFFIPYTPVVFPAEPQVAMLNGICTSNSLASRPTYLANPPFSVNIPVPSPFQPVLANVVAVSQPVVYPPLIFHPDAHANPSLSLASHQPVPRTLPRTQLQNTELASSRLAQPASQSRLAKPTSPIQHTEQADAACTTDKLDPLPSASRTQGQAPGFSGDGHPVSSPSAKPPGLQPLLRSPSVKQPENVHRTWLNSMPCSSVPAADDSVVAAPSAGVHSKPAGPAHQKQHDAVNASVTSPRTPSSSASHQPASSSSCMSCTESDSVPYEPLVSVPQPHHVHVNSAITTSNVQPSTLLHSSQGSPISTASQASDISFRPNTGYDASRQSKPLPGLSGEGSGQDSHHFTLPENQRHPVQEEPTQPSPPQSSPPRQSSDNCVIL